MVKSRQSIPLHGGADRMKKAAAGRRKGLLHFGYDALTEKGARRTITTTRKAEDDILNATNRGKLISGARDQQRNFSLAQWMVNRHLDYVTSFSLQVRTGDKVLDDRVESLFEWWGRRKNCDVAKRHSFHSFIRLLELHAVVDGDCALNRLNNGRLQAIEGDRIGDPKSGNVPERVRKAGNTQGVILDNFGAAKSYIINRRRNGGLEYERTIPESRIELHAYLRRFDQIRGVSPLACAINTLQDVYEGFDAAIVKAKLHALFGVAIKRQMQDETDGFEYTDRDDGEAADAETDRYELTFDGGVGKLELEPGDDVDTIESKTPSNEFRDYSLLMIQISMLALDIPITLFDPRESSFSAARQDLLTYIKSVRSKRQKLQDILNTIFAWKVSQWLNAVDTETGGPMLELPGGMAARDIKPKWIFTGVPWIDPAKEQSAESGAIRDRTKSRQQIAAEKGYDWWETLDEIDAEETEMDRRGIVFQIADPGGVVAGQEMTDGDDEDE